MGFYIGAKEKLLDLGYFAEIDAQERASTDLVGETEILRELAWVVLSSGIREQVVRKVFAQISAAFCHWSSAEIIVRNLRSCVAGAIEAFRHRRKIESIGANCDLVHSIGAAEILHRAQLEGPTFFQRFDYVGPITCQHVAKNLGFDVVKADRHLDRIATLAGYESPTAFCSSIRAASSGSGTRPPRKSPASPRQTPSARARWRFSLRGSRSQTSWREVSRIRRLSRSRSTAGSCGCP